MFKVSGLKRRNSLEVRFGFEWFLTFNVKLETLNCSLTRNSKLAFAS